jgi:hypothetical protein
MTNSSRWNSDFYADQFDSDLSPVARRLDRVLGPTAVSHEAPEEVRAATLAAIRTARHSTSRSAGTSVTLRRRTFTRFASGGLVLAAAVAIVVVLESAVVGAPATSADSVFRHAAYAGLKPGQAAHLRYHVKMSGSQLKVPQTGTATVRILPAAGTKPEVAREDLSVLPRKRGQTWCIALHIVVVGKWGYSAPYANCGGMGGPMLFYSLFMSSTGPCLCGPSWFPEGALTADALYGESVARQLLNHPRAGAVLRRGRFDGRSVFIITVAHWPDQPFLKRVTLDFDTHSYVLLGIDATANTIRYQFNLIASHIGSSKLLPRNTFRLAPPPPGNSFPMQVPVSGSRAKLMRLCPGIQDLKHLLDMNYGPLRSCKTAIPTMTARHLAHLFTGPTIPQAVWQAERAGVFNSTYARKGLAASLTYMTKWVTWGHSLRYNNSTVR